MKSLFFYSFLDPIITKVPQEQFERFPGPISPKMLIWNSRCRLKIISGDSCLLLYNFPARKIFGGSKNHYFHKLEKIPTNPPYLGDKNLGNHIYLVDETISDNNFTKKSRNSISTFGSGEPWGTFGEPLILIPGLGGASKMRYSESNLVFCD